MHYKSGVHRQDRQGHPAVSGICLLLKHSLPQLRIQQASKELREYREDVFRYADQETGLAYSCLLEEKYLAKIKRSKTLISCTTRISLLVSKLWSNPAREPHALTCLAKPCSACHDKFQRPQTPTAGTVKASFCFDAGFIASQKDPSSRELTQPVLSSGQHALELAMGSILLDENRCIQVSSVGWEESNTKPLQTQNAHPGFLNPLRKLHPKHKIFFHDC